MYPVYEAKTSIVTGVQRMPPCAYVVLYVLNDLQT